MPSYQVVFFAFLMIWNWNFINATLLKPRIYEIRKVNSTCTSQEIKIRLDFNRNFRGFIYAKGFPLEKTCSTYGSGEDFVEIFLDTSECGVRLVASDVSN